MSSYRRPPTLDDVTLAPKGEAIQTFSNGTDWECWASGNCLSCRWWDPDTAGKFCAFEAAAFLRGVSPELARKFGWLRDEAGAAKWCKEHGEADDLTDWWEAPDECAFFMSRRPDDGGDDDRPDPPIIDPTQLSFLAPEGWPDAPSAVPAPLADQRRSTTEPAHV